MENDGMAALYEKCKDVQCQHERYSHHPQTGICGVDEVVAGAYVDGDGLHETQIDRCRCGGFLE